MAIYSLGTGKMQRVDVSANHAKNNLQIGQVLRMDGYDNPKFIIVERGQIDEQFGYGRRYKTVNMRDYRFGSHDAFSMDFEDGINRGIHVYITPEVLPLDDCLHYHELATAQIQKDADAKATEVLKFAHDKDQMRANHPELHVGDDRITAAKNIRIELKKKWPSVKFSVTSESFSGGNAVNVGWVDGPTTEAVNKILNKYEGGSFDGMTDSYTYSKAPWSDTFGHAKYIHSSRELSRAMFERAIKETGLAGVVEESARGHAWIVRDGNHENAELIGRHAYRLSAEGC